VIAQIYVLRFGRARDFLTSIVEFLCYDSTMMSERQITFPTSAMLSPIAMRFGLRFIVLFGSVARDMANSESDIDLGILAEQPLTFDKRLEIWSALSALFLVDVDLAVLNHADPVLRFEVASSGRILFESKPFAWENWKSYAFRQYWDTKKFRDDLKGYVSRRAEEIRNAISK
jgi:predicted nucleotidyltransferase